MSNTTTFHNYSCVAKAGWGARIRWYNGSGNAITEYSPHDTDLPSVYVTYSINNVSTILNVQEPGYIIDLINSVYPVHTATLHFSGTQYQGQNRSFTCEITGVKAEFLQQYNVQDDDLLHFMTVNINASSASMSHLTSASSSSNLSSGLIIGIVIGAILFLTVIIMIIFICYGMYWQRPKTKTLSIQTPFSHLTSESPIGIDINTVGGKVQFPREKITLLHVLGKFFFW